MPVFPPSSFCSVYGIWCSLLTASSAGIGYGAKLISLTSIVPNGNSKVHIGGLPAVRMTEAQYL